MLNNFFIAFRQAEVITWESFVLPKQYPGSTKEGFRLAGMKLFPNFARNFLQNIIYTKCLKLPGSPKNVTKFHTGQPGSCNPHLSFAKGFIEKVSLPKFFIDVSLTLMFFNIILLNVLFQGFCFGLNFHKRTISTLHVKDTKKH